MKTYTLTTKQLKNLIAFTLERFAASPGVFDFSGGAQAENVEAIMAMVESNGLCPDCSKPVTRLDNLTTCTHCQRTWTEDSRLENSLSLVDEDDWWLDDSQSTEHLRLVEIPFDGSITTTTDDGDNINPAAIGLEPVA